LREASASEPPMNCRKRISWVAYMPDDRVSL
jgi:hypothetical protein